MAQETAEALGLSSLGLRAGDLRDVWTRPREACSCYWEGTRTHEAIVRALARAGLVKAVRAALPESLHWLARMALIEA